MGAIGIAILSKKNKSEKSIDLNIKDINFITKATECDKCPNNCEILRIYKMIIKLILGEVCVVR